MASLLFDMHASDSRNELVVCRVFATLFLGAYRARYGDAVYAYDRGPWSKTKSPTYESLDFATTSLRSDDGVFHAMHVDGPHGGNFRDVARRVFGILSIASMAEFLGRVDDRAIDILLGS